MLLHISLVFFLASMFVCPGVNVGMRVTSHQGVKSLMQFHNPAAFPKLDAYYWNLFVLLLLFFLLNIIPLWTLKRSGAADEMFDPIDEEISDGTRQVCLDSPLVSVHGHVVSQRIREKLISKWYSYDIEGCLYLCITDDR